MLIDLVHQLNPVDGDAVDALIKTLLEGVRQSSEQLNL